MRRLGVLVTVSAFFLGCSGGSDGVSPAQAQADCTAFVASDYCGKATGCISGIDEATCVSSVKTTIDCTTAVGENGKLTICESDLAAESCAVFYDGTNINLPASCKSVFLH